MYCINFKIAIKELRGIFLFDYRYWYNDFAE